VLAVAACSGSKVSPEPTITPAAATATAAPAATDAPATSLPMTQSETGWGRIWDAVPSSFHVPEGAQPAEPETGPVSAAYTVPRTAAAPRAIAEQYRDALDDVGYGTGLDGPLEDGSFTVWSSNAYGCDTLTTVLPRGDESLVTVLYGAGCPFE